MLFVWFLTVGVFVVGKNASRAAWFFRRACVRAGFMLRNGSLRLASLILRGSLFSDGKICPLEKSPSLATALTGAQTSSGFGHFEKSSTTPSKPVATRRHMSPPVGTCRPSSSFSNHERAKIRANPLASSVRTIWKPPRLCLNRPARNPIFSKPIFQTITQRTQRTTEIREATKTPFIFTQMENQFLDRMNGMNRINRME